MIMLRYIFALLLLAFLCACENRSRVCKQLEALDSLACIMPTSPESSVNYDSILVQLDTLRNKVIVSDYIAAHWNLLYAMSEDKAGHPLCFDLHIRPAYDYYNKATKNGIQGDSILLHRLAQSCFYMGVYYYHCDSTAQLAQMMYKASEIAKKCNDHYTAYLALTYLSERIKTTNSSEAILLAEKALTEYKQSKHQCPYNEICILLIAGNNYFYGETALRARALDYYQQALKCSLEHDSVLINDVYTQLVYYYLYQRKMSAAYAFFQKVHQGVSTKKDKHSVGLCANLYLRLDSLDKAREYIQRLLPIADNTEKFYCFQNLQKIAIRQHDNVWALSLNDSLRHYAWVMGVEKSQDAYLLTKETLEKEWRIERLKHRNIVLFITFGTVGIILLLTAGIIVFIMRQRIKQRNKLVEIEKMRKILLSEVKDLEVKKLEKEVAWRSEKIVFLKEHLILQSDVIERIVSIDSNSEKFIRLTEKEWNRLEVTLDESCDNFVSRLRSTYISLSDEDIRMCMLQKLHLSNRQMANIFVLQPESITKRKQRLKKILFPEGDRRSFDEIIESI